MNIASDNSTFFHKLPGFKNFAEHALDDEFYRPLPDDWFIIIADIVSSTDAVEQGRYQDVNYVGAACIAALKNVISEYSVPTVFGGDGASAAVSADDLETALKALTATRHWAMAAFSLELRIGAVQVSELIAQGEHAEVGKLNLGRGNELAMFRGRGFELAEQLVKDNREDNPYRVNPAIDSGSLPDLDSLSCRWSPLSPEHEVILCVLIEVRAQADKGKDGSNAVYRDVLRRINDIVEIDSPTSNPVKRSNLNFRLKYKNLMLELRSASGSCIKRVASVVGLNIFAAFSFRFGYKMGRFDPALYQQQILSNSDYKRINGTIQLVLDCTNHQSDSIETMLDLQYKKMKINYGLYKTDSALITCITPDIPNGVHVHYIDGANGGFWHAANALKTRRSLG